MRKTTIALGAGLMAALGCNPQIANLGGNGDAGTTSALPSGVTVTDELSKLDDTQAGAVCAWLIQQWEAAFPGDRPNDSTNGLPPGYVQGGGQGVGCSGQLIFWTVLDQQDCVLNLRQSPCAATMGALAQCVNAFTAPPNSSSAPAPCSGACTAFESAPSCSQTIFVAGDAGACAYALPIVPDASCVEDGGT